MKKVLSVSTLALGSLLLAIFMGNSAGVTDSELDALVGGGGSNCLKVRIVEKCDKSFSKDVTGKQHDEACPGYAKFEMVAGTAGDTQSLGNPFTCTTPCNWACGSYTKSFVDCRGRVWVFIEEPAPIDVDME